MADLTSRILVVISASSGGAVKELDSLQRQADKAGTSFDTIGKKAGLAGATIKTALVAGASAFVGAGLVSFLNDSVTAFADAQKAASLFSTAMNTSGEDAGKLATYLNTLGIDTNDLIEINAEFGKAIGENGDALDDLGVSLKRNRDGSIDTADAFVQVVDGLKGVKDGAARSQLALQFFGEEGTKQLAPLIFGSKNLKDTLEDLEFVYDPKRAQEYAAAQQDLNLAFQTLQQTVGQALIPVATDAARVAADVIGVLGAIPTDIYLVAGAAFALSRVLTVDLVAGAFGAVRTGALLTAASLTSPTLAFGLMSAAAQTASAKIATAFAANPVTVVLVGLAAAYAAFSFAQNDFNDAVAEGVGRVRELEEAGKDTASAVSQVATEMEASRNAVQDFFAAYKGKDLGDLASSVLQGPIGVVRAVVDALRDGGNDVAAYEAALAKLREEEGALAAGSADLAVKQRELGDLLREGGYSAEELAAAITQSGDAMNAQNAATEAASGYMDAYESSTRKAADATLALFDKQFAAQDAQRSYNDSIREYDEALKNSEATADDRAAALQGIGEAAIDAAVAQSEAARQQDLLNGVYQDSTVYTQMTIEALKQLSQQPGLPAEAKANIDGFITSLEAAQTKAGAGIEVDASVTADTASADTAVEVLKRRIRDAGQAGNQGQVSALSLQLVPAATSTTVTVTTAGVPQAQAQIDALAAARSTTLTVNTDFSPDGYNALKMRKDYLSQDRTATITNNVVFSPDGYNALKARKDYLAQNRTATITINQVTGSRVTTGGGEDGEGRPRAIPNLYANVSPTNIFKVAIDGQPLRAWIRSEVAAAQPVTAGVA